MKRSMLKYKALSAAISVAAFAQAAFAQSGTRPPAPGDTETPKTWLYYIVIIILAALTITISILPGKRSHQD